MWVPVVSFFFLLLACDVPLFLERYGSPSTRSAWTASPSPSQPLAASRSASATAAATTVLLEDGGVGDVGAAAVA